MWSWGRKNTLKNCATGDKLSLESLGGHNIQASFATFMFLDSFDNRSQVFHLGARAHQSPLFVRKINLRVAFHDKSIAQFPELCKRLIPYVLLVHDQDRSESYFPAHHMLVCLLRVFQGERFNQAFNVMKLRESNGLFAVKGMTRRVPSYRSSFLDQVIGADLDHTGWGQHEQMTTRLETTCQRPNSGRIWSCCDDESCSAQFQELLIHIAFRSVNIVVGAKLKGKIAFGISAAQGYNSIPKLVRV